MLFARGEIGTPPMERHFLGNLLPSPKGKASTSPGTNASSWPQLLLLQWPLETVSSSQHRLRGRVRSPNGLLKGVSTEVGMHLS